MRIIGIAVLTDLGDTKVGPGFIPTPWGDVIAVVWAIAICPFGVSSGLDQSTADAVLESIRAEVGDPA